MRNIKFTSVRRKCNAVYQNRSHLSWHKANCLNVTKFECVGCSKYFSRRDSLQKHRKKCSGKKSLVCSVCSSTFPSTWKLSRHIKQVHEKPTFTCNNCSQKFGHEPNFRSHQIKCSKSIDEKPGDVPKNPKRRATGGFEPVNYFESAYEEDEEVRN